MDKPRFNGRLIKATGNGEQVEVVFSAADQGELRSRLTQAAAVCTERMRANNEEVLEVAKAVNLNVEKMKAAARREVREELGLPPEGEEGNGAAAGPAHLRADP